MAIPATKSGRAVRTPSYETASTSDYDDDYGNREVVGQPYQRATSVRAHIVLSVGVTMSTAEMDLLVDALEKTDRDAMSDTQREVVGEFIQEVKSVR